MTFAIIQTGGKQYKVSPNQKIKIEKLNAEEGDNFIFDKVLLIAEGDDIKIGTPYVDGAKVEAKILKQGRDKKKIVFKYHSKTRFRKKKGHRQSFTETEITKIRPTA
ncbi:50S ribosomal protein L21 [Candidatus Wolfebacteria bacterium]|nr:50S ribosomal protein L21 [Candidatus Wolfebacteria bacterium]